MTILESCHVKTKNKKNILEVPVVLNTVYSYLQNHNEHTLVL